MTTHEATPSRDPATASEGAPLAFWGGTLGALAPFALLLAGVITLGIAGAPDERGFWPLLVAALGLGAALARDRKAWSEATLGGMSRPIVMLMVLAWLLAGVMASVLGASGLVGALVAVARSVGFSGGGFAAAAFAVAAFVSTATGTSLGTLILCAPLLYPAGVALGAMPSVLAGAILGGATFGDNISPVSDTTIASATTQDAAMGAVVRSRLRYALPAAAAALVATALLGGGGTATAPATAAHGSALLMLLAPVLVIALLVRGGLLVPTLLAGSLVSAALAVALGRVSPHQLFHLERASYTAQGLLLDGLERGVGVSIFTLLLMGLAGGLERSGVLERAVAAAERRAASARDAEAWIVVLVSLAVLATTHAVVAILLAGPFARDMGARHNLAATRRANLLDLTVCTWPFLLPWFIPTILMASMTRGHSADPTSTAPALGPWTIGLWNLHAWGLLAMVIAAVAFGWGRRKDR